MDNELYTPFSMVYDSFLSKITDDMYMELTPEDTYKLMEELLISAIPKFEFPRIDISNYTKNSVAIIEKYKQANVPDNHFNVLLNAEEVNILATYMVVEWLGQQLASVENVRMKYSGNDFKFTSQANHMQKILATKKDYEREGFHLQRLYKRRERDENGIYRSTMGSIMEQSPEGRSNL